MTPHSPPIPVPAPPPSPSAPTMSPGGFLLLALQLFVTCLAAGAYVVFRDSHRGGAAPLAGEWAPLWAGMQTALLLLAAATAAGVLPQLRQRRRAAAMTLAAMASIYAVAAVGVRGIELVDRVREPVVVSLAEVRGTPATPAPPPDEGAGLMPAAPAGGDATAGQRAFAASCAGCHGAAAEGIAGIAPALRGSEFVSASADAAIAAVIANGRTAADPASKTGKVMPPRGGNPFLSDQDVENLVAYLKGSSSGAAAGGTATASTATAGTATAGTAAAPDPRQALPRWVVPAPAAPPAGVVPVMAESVVDAPNLASAAASPVALRREAGGRLFATVFTATHAVFVLIGAALMAGLLWQAYASRLRDEDLLSARFVRLYWVIAAVMWLVLLPLLYVL